MARTSRANQNRSDQVAGALARVLRPLVRLALARGVTFAVLAELLKRVMVEVAERDFRLDGKAQTDSRISLLTGVHRKDVRRLRAPETRVGASAPEAGSFGAQVIARWLSTAPFATRAGKPKPLARLASAGGERSFEALVAGLSTDIRPRAVLDEWLRSGLVHLDDAERVVLDAEAFVPEPDSEAKAFYLAHNLHDHAAAAVHNVLGGKPAMLERSVYYEGLDAEDVAALGKRAEADGMDLLKALNRQAAEAERAAARTTQAKHRFTFGIYFYRTPLDAERPAQD